MKKKLLIMSNFVKIFKENIKRIALIALVKYQEDDFLFNEIFIEVIPYTTY